MSFTPPPPVGSHEAHVELAEADPLALAVRLRLRRRARHAGLLLVLVLAPAEVALAGSLKNIEGDKGSHAFRVLGGINAGVGWPLLLAGVWLLLIALGTGFVPPAGQAARQVLPMRSRSPRQPIQPDELSAWVLAPARVRIRWLAPLTIAALICRGIGEPGYERLDDGAHSVAVGGLVVTVALLAVAALFAAVMTARSRAPRRYAGRIDPTEVLGGGYVPRRRPLQAAAALPVLLVALVFGLIGRSDARGGTGGSGGSGSSGSSASSGPDAHEMTVPSLTGTIVRPGVYAYSGTTEFEDYLADVVGAPHPLSSREILFELEQPRFGNTQLDLDERFSVYATPAAAALGQRVAQADDKAGLADAPAPKPPADPPALSGFGPSAWIPSRSNGPASDLVTYRIDGSTLVRLRISPFGIPVGEADPDLEGTLAQAQLIAPVLAAHQAALDALPPGPS